MEKRKIRVGSRESALAVAQSRWVMDVIAQAHPELELELVTMKTTGDKILDRPLDKVGGKGLFVKELDRALQDGRIDLSVHSLKDMPMEQPTGLPIAAYTRRADPRDVLVLPQGAAEPDPGKPIGCSSARRRLQLEALYPGWEVVSVRGNVQTRLAKLESGYAALVLARAGLERLGLEHRVSRVFSTAEMIPAAGQGILAVQAREGECAFLDCVDDPDGRCAALAERAFVRALDGGCSSPIAAYARPEGQTLLLTGLYYEEATGRYAVASIEGSRDEAERLGLLLAERMRGK